MDQSAKGMGWSEFRVRIQGAEQGFKAVPYIAEMLFIGTCLLPGCSMHICWALVRVQRASSVCLPAKGLVPVMQSLITVFKHQPSGQCDMR